jgi:uncharacterized membrane protein YfcA
VEITGYIASIGIGLSLGLIGGGGSILTVPILIWFFHIEPLLASTYSLFVVGFTSLAGAISHFRKGNVNGKLALLFSIPSLVVIFILRKWIMPALPDHIATVGRFELTKPELLMLVFAGLMLTASIGMIRRTTPPECNPEPSNDPLYPNAESTNAPSYPNPESTNDPSFPNPVNQTRNPNYPKLIGLSLLIGAITGFVGVGGGFLIIPSLVLFARLPMRTAVGTSLLIMTISSLLGVLGDISHPIPIDYSFLAVFSAFAVTGVLTGSYLNKYVNDTRLKPLFGWFVFCMGIVVLINTLHK